ncbi:MAG: Gfo/Idh/MocA family oxidoreductase [Deltaproteobacteria bacterium]|nr:Gfo/Idh/MocA family oxidoreductase [Deltaproteobacteria bacterium]
MTGIAFVGCGYVADYYLTTLPNHEGLELRGVFDRDRERLERFCRHHDTRSYGGLQELLDDPSVGIVVNLTNPENHYEVSRACLEAGKHVYSEKPLAMEMPLAEKLVELAEERALLIASAPCGLLGETAQTLWKALREEKVGTVRVVYAEMDDGLVHRRNYREWMSESGSAWPYKDEFETGCTLEHAGYYLTWLTAFFGPAASVTSFASCQIPDKGTDVALDPASTPDFSVACLQFAGGVVARLTCSIIAPFDRSIRIIGDDGVLSARDCWDYGSTVYLRRRTALGLRAEKHPWVAPFLGVGRRRVPPVRKTRFQYGGRGSDRMDFCRGIAELAAASEEGRACRMSARHALHVNEITLAIAQPEPGGAFRQMGTRFEPIEPVAWAR